LWLLLKYRMLKKEQWPKYATYFNGTAYWVIVYNAALKVDPNCDFEKYKRSTFTDELR
jgi:hypothetical protein